MRLPRSWESWAFKMTHIPVLLKEVIGFLNPQENDFVIDGTVDGGGHMKTILPRLGKKGIYTEIWYRWRHGNCLNNIWFYETI